MNTDRQKTEISNWVRLYTEYLFHWAYKKTSDDQLSQDLVQDTFLAAFESFGSFKHESQPKTWLTGILKNKIAEHYRKKIRQQIFTAKSEQELSDYFKPDGTWDMKPSLEHWHEDSGHLMNLPAFNKVFLACIDHLPTLMNTCIRLKFLDEKKGEQICQELGISPTNYWQLVHRAKLHLRDCLDKYWFSAS